MVRVPEGQKIVEEEGYIKVEEDAAAYETNGAEGKVVVAGSSSVTPVMEKLKESYASVNANVMIEINTSDSSTGVSQAIEGTCDIGMASRALKDSEKEAGVVENIVAIDGIAVVVDTANTVSGLTKQQLISKSRTSNIANARQIAMYLCRKMTDASLKSIGAQLGKRDHTTIINGQKRIEDELKSNNSSIKNNIDIIMKKINPM